MSEKSISLKRALVREIARHAGSCAVIAFYNGELPRCCEDQADGEHLVSVMATSDDVRGLAEGEDPTAQKGAKYWRLLSNEGNVVMQGRCS